MSFMTEKEQTAFNEFLQLRNDDAMFEEQWEDTGEAFDEWYKNVYLNPGK